MNIFFSRNYSLKMSPPWIRSMKKLSITISDEYINVEEPSLGSPVASSESLYQILTPLSSPSRSLLQSDSPVNITTSDILNKTNQSPTPSAVNQTVFSTPTSHILHTTPEKSVDRNRKSSPYAMELSNLSSVNGMTFCLVMLDKCFQEFQRR